MFTTMCAVANPLKNPVNNYLNNWRIKNRVTSVVVCIGDLKHHRTISYTSDTLTRDGLIAVTPKTLYGVEWYGSH